ncbi:helix-turn-helix domain-containing protein [Agrococcus sp. DT81.2]|uniref:helix-turn-helix domain-containing protein n=1 Tax=Agrococcus sp. DT81.2 TaxID=3393414 RepID=UPI003CE5A1C6
MTALTAEQLAEHLGVTAETIRIKANADEIPGMRIGRLWRFDLAEVTAALKPSTDSWAQPAQSKRAKRKH